MKAIFAKGNQRTVNKLIGLRKEAKKENEYRVATRIHAVILSIEGNTSGEIATLLKANRTNIPVWINNGTTMDKMVCLKVIAADARVSLA